MLQTTSSTRQVILGVHSYSWWEPRADGAGMGPAASQVTFVPQPGPSFSVTPQQGLTPCRLAGCSGGVSWESQEGKSFWGL